jgi:phospholipase/carboxylesterase
MNIQTLRCEFATPAEPNGQLVVVLHGRGDSSAGFHWMPNTLALPGVSWLLVNAPDSWYGGFSWYDMPPDHGPGIKRSRLLLDKLFDELLDQGFPPEKTVLFGFSQGCLLTLEWGGRTDRPLAGCVGISGYVYDADALGREASAAARARPWLVTHGRQDEVLPYADTAGQIATLKAAGLPIDFRSYAKTHTIGPDLDDIRDAMVKMLKPSPKPD